jgi:carbamoyltransferase
VVINTSFNIRGEPIVCTPEDALRCFVGSDMDVLVLEDCVLLKSEQPPMSREEMEKYLGSFGLD